MTKYIRAKILSVGSCVPDTVMCNAEFEKFLDTSDEWIASRTGIRQRHIVPRDQSVPASELGITAVKRAIDRAGIDPGEVDGIICATFTPDNFFPSTACRIQAALGCTNAYAFDLSAACAGFVYALTVANSLIVSGQSRNVVVVGAEVISKTLDWTDRGTCILFGDAAGAVVLQGTQEQDRGVLSSYLSSDGTLGDILVLPAWGERRTMRMRGNEVFKHAVRMMVDASMRAVQASGWDLVDLDLVIPHQANSRIIKSFAEHLRVPLEKVVTNLEHYGNTSSASIPLALEEAWAAGRISEGTKVLFTSLGGGVTVASAVAVF